MLLFQDLYSTNGIFCYVLFSSAASFLRSLKCHSFLVFLPAMINVEVSAIEMISVWKLVIQCPWLLICLLLLFVELTTWLDLLLV